MTLFGDFCYPISPDVATFLLCSSATAFGSTVLIISPKRANLALVMQMLLEAHKLLYVENPVRVGRQGLVQS